MADEFNPKQATDPHEDKWNRLTVSSRANDLKGAVDVNEKLDDYIAFSRHKISSGLSFQDQAFREMNKHEDKLKAFNQRILKDFEDLKRTKNFPSQHYRFPVSNEPLASSFIVNPEQISPLVKASEERIKALEKEMDHRERDTVKMNGVIELLIEENRYLRDHISAKNRDITKILETVGLNDGETTHDLRHRINLLSEENNLLLSHLEELKAVKDNFERFNREKNNEILRANAEYEQCRQSLEEALKREEILTNYKQMVDPKFRQAQEKVAEFEASMSDLIEELNQVKSQNVVLSNQVATYRRGLDDAEGKQTLELDRLVQEVNMLQNEKKEHKKVIEAKDKTIEERQNELRKIRKDLEQTRLEFEETVQVMNEQKNHLANERQTTEVAVKREKELKERNNALADELERLQSKMKILEDDHAREVENLKFNLSGQEAKFEQKLEKQKRKSKDKEEANKTEIASLKAQLEEVAKILDSVSAEREEYARKYEALAKQEQTFAYRENRLRDLEEQVDRLNKEVDRYQAELADNERRYRAQNEDLRAESNKLNDINKDLLEEIAGLKREVDETAKKGPSGNARNGVYDSTKEHTRESVKRRAPEYDRTVESFSPTRREGKTVTDLEKENQYLHQMIKNLVQTGDSQRPNHFAADAGTRGSAIREHQPSHSPIKTTSADIVRQSYLDRSKAIIGASSLSPLRTNPVGEFTELSQARRSGDNFAYQRKDDERIRLTPYQMRSSVTVPNADRLQRDSANNFTDVKRRESQGVDNVISNILKKYNMEKVPDYNGKNRYAGSGSEYLREPSREGGNLSGIGGREGAGFRSPQMQFLSPLLSTPKYESKTGSIVNSINRKEDVADRILSPDPTFLARQGR